MRSSNISRSGLRPPRWLLACGSVAVVLVYFAAQSRALDPGRTLSQYMRERWGSERGFPGGSVTSFAQTSDGYLWVGGEKGLIRFDGLGFQSFPQATPLPVTIDAVQQLSTDAEGNLWVLLQSTKILRYRNGKFELGRDEAEYGVTALSKRPNGAVLFSSLAYGELIYNAGKFQALQPPQKGALDAPRGTTDTLSSRLSWATGVATHRLAEPDSAVIATAEAADGKIWLGTRDKGLFSLADGRVAPASKTWGNGKVTCVLPREQGKLWVGTESGLLEWDGEQLTQGNVPTVLQKSSILALLRDRDANIWVGTAAGLYRINHDGVSYDVSQSAAPMAATALFEDREGNVWVGSPRGIERLRESAFVTYAMGRLQSESSGPVYVDAEGRVWFAPFEGGLHWLQDGKTGGISNDELDKDVVYSITGDEDGLWIGRQRGGLTRLRYGSKISTTTYTQADGLAQNGVYAVYESHDGAVWAATLSSGVSRYADGRFTTYSKTNGAMASDSVMSMAESPDRTMWFATPNGLNVFSKGQWRLLSTREGLPSDIVYCLLPDSSGVLWIGTASGLASFVAGHLSGLEQAPAALHEAILGMAEDRMGRLWIATAKHVLAVKRVVLLGGRVGDDDIREYGMEDGLLGTEGVKRDHSVVADNMGRVWFSMNRGLSMVDTVRATDKSAPAIVQVEGISADGTPLDLKQPLRVPPGSHRVTFNYSGLSLSVPERVRFKYKLEGFDKNWSEAVGAHEAVYTNLDSGPYKFRVMASNSDGNWNGAEAALRLQIAPVYWQTWWFRLCIALVLALAVLLYLRVRLLGVTRQMNIRFEERLAERARIARELHDSLLQGFQGLIFRLQAIRDMLPGNPNDAVTALDKALDNADQVIAEGRSTVEDLRYSSAGDNDIVQALTALGEELAHPNQNGETTALRVLVEGKPRELDPILRDEIYRIAREALRNAFQHAHAHTVEAEVTYGDSEFLLRVRDDGTGIDPQVFEEGRRAGHWGLPGMHERARGFGGELQVWSEYGAGTEIELTVPGPLAYGASSARSRFWFLGRNVHGSHGPRS